NRAERRSSAGRCEDEHVSVGEGAEPPLLQIPRAWLRQTQEFAFSPAKGETVEPWGLRFGSHGSPLTTRWVGRGGVHLLRAALALLKEPDGEDQPNSRWTRRFCAPFFSILPSFRGPISAVLATCVPPQGCRSMSPMRTRRTR